MKQNIFLSIFLFFSFTLFGTGFDINQYYGVINQNSTPVYANLNPLEMLVNTSLDQGQKIDIIGISEDLYNVNSIQAHYFRVKTKEGIIGWIFGGNFIAIAMADTYPSRNWYERKNDKLLITYNELTKKYKFQLGPRWGESYESNHRRKIFEVDNLFSGSSTYVTRNREKNISDEIAYEWDTSDGTYNFNISAINQEGKNYSYNQFYSVNIDDIGYDRIYNNIDEATLWFYIKNNKFKELNKIFEDGFDKFKNKNVLSSDSPLVYCVDNNKYKMIKFLLEHGASQTYNTREPHVQTISILQRSIQNNNLNMVSFLLENGIGKTIGTRNDILFCLDDNHLEMIDLLYNNGYTFNNIIHESDIYENYSITSSLLTRAIDKNAYKVAMRLIDYGADINFLVNRYYDDKAFLVSPLKMVEKDISKYEHEVLVYENWKKTDSEAFVEKVYQYNLSQLDTLKKLSLKITSSIDYKPLSYLIRTNMKYGIITDMHVNFRSEPTLSGTVLGQLNKDDEIEILEESEKMMNIDLMRSYWYKVKTTKNEVGWCYGYFIDNKEHDIQYHKKYSYK